MRRWLDSRLGPTGADAVLTLAYVAILAGAVALLVLAAHPNAGFVYNAF